jgi:stage V sporulation protein G
MNITAVKIYPLKDSKTLALASITIDSDFVVSGLKVLDGQNGVWVAMPNRKDSKNEYHDIAFPISKEARSTIQKVVIDKYYSLDDERFEPPVIEGKSEHRTGYDKAPSIDVVEDDLPF